MTTMHETLSVRSSELTPSQAADIIEWYHAGENKEARKAGYPDKVSLGESAIHAAYEERSEYLIPPMTEPLLSWKEVGRGMKFISPSTDDSQPVIERPRDYRELAANDR